MAIAPVLRVVAKRLIPLLLELGFEELKALTMKEDESGASMVLEGSFQGSEVNMLVSLTVGEDGMVTFGFGPYKTTGSISRWIQMLGDQFASMPSGKPGSVVKTLSNISLLTKLQKVISRFPKSLQKSASTRNWVRGEVQVATPKGDNPSFSGFVLGNWSVLRAFNAWNVTHIPSGLKIVDLKSKDEGIQFVESFLETHPQLLDATKDELLRHGKDITTAVREMQKLRFDKTTGKSTDKSKDLAYRFAHYLESEGLNLLNYDGKFSGKSGKFYGIKGKTLAIAIGTRDIMLNRYNLEYIYGYGNKIQGKWGMAQIKSLKEMNEAKLDMWIKMVKNSMTTDEVRAKLRDRGPEIYEY